MVKCFHTGRVELSARLRMFSVSDSLSLPTASAPMVSPPLQTMFQLLPVLCDQPTLDVYCERPAFRPKLMIAVRIVVRRAAVQ